MRPISMVSTLAILVSGCGGTPMSKSSDLGSSDMASSPSDGGTGDMAMVKVTGTKVVGGTALQLPLNDYPIMDDGTLVYQDKMGFPNAVPLAGGKAEAIATSAAFSIFPKAVFSYSNIDQAAGAGDLSVWTPSQKTVGSPIPSVITVTGNNAGTWMAYLKSTSGDGSVADLYVSKLDGTSSTKVASGVAFSTDMAKRDACGPNWKFAGDTLVASYCVGNATTATVVAVASGTTVTLLAGAKPFFALNKDNTQVVVSDAAGNVKVVPIGGGNGTPIDAKFASGLLLNGEDTLLYVTSDMKLKRSPLTSPSPTALVMADVGAMWRAFGATDPAVSPDKKYVLFNKNFNPDTNSGEIYLASVTTPGTATAIVDQQTGLLQGDAFTTDSSRVLYYKNVKSVGKSAVVADLFSLPVGGGTPVAHGTKVWNSWAGTGTLVVYNDNYKSSPKSSLGDGRADLRVLDVAKSDAAMLLAAQAEADFYLTAAKDKVVFALQQGGADQQGIYVAPLQ